MKESILNGWLWRRAINGTLSSIVMVNLFVVVWGGETTPMDRALYMLIQNAVAMAWSGFGESVKIRSWIMTRYTKLLWCMISCDLLLLPLYPFSPYGYFICSVLFLDGAYCLLFQTLMGEVKEVLLTEPNQRNSFIPKSQKMMYAGNIAGGVLSMLIPLSEMGTPAMIIGIIISCVGCATITTLALYGTLKYMRENSLQFHCVQKEAEAE